MSEGILTKIEKRIRPEKFGGMCALGYDKLYCFGIDDLNNIKELLDFTYKQKKIIEKMAEQLATPIHSKEWVIKHFEKEV